jgi:hypothetical protein
MLKAEENRVHEPLLQFRISANYVIMVLQHVYKKITHEKKIILFVLVHFGLLFNKHPNPDSQSTVSFGTSVAELIYISV